MLAVKTRNILEPTTYGSDDTGGDEALLNENAVRFDIGSGLGIYITHGNIVSGDVNTNVPINVKTTSYTPSTANNDEKITISCWIKFDDAYSNLMTDTSNWYTNSTGAHYKFIYLTYLAKKRPLVYSYIFFMINSSGTEMVNLYTRRCVYNSSSSNNYSYVGPWYRFVGYGSPNYDNINALYNDWSNNWKNFTLVFDNGNIRHYMNGEQLGSNYVDPSYTSNPLPYDSVTLTTNNYQIPLGHSYPNGSNALQYYTGMMMDEVSIFKQTALTDNEVSELYNDGVPFDLTTHSQSANLWAWYRMGDHANDNFTAGQSGGCYDATGNGNDLDVDSDWIAEQNVSDAP